MINILITSSIMITVLCAVRKIFMGKISRRLQYFLWIFVALRLLVPVQLLENVYNFANVFAPVTKSVEEFGEVTVIGNAELVGEPEYTVEKPSFSSESKHKSTAENIVETTTESDIEYVTGTVTIQPEISVSDILKMLWFTGICVCIVIFVVSNVVFMTKLRKSRIKVGNENGLTVYETDLFQTPCLYGFLKPSIYLTGESLKFDKERVKLIIAHESTHYKHLDHIWAMVRSLCLIIYWFDPFVWLAVKLSIRDSELACDESVLTQIGEENRTLYGQTILDVAAGNTGILYCATGISSGKRELKERIIMITANHKVLIVSSVLVAAVIVVLAVSAFGGNEDRSGILEETTKSENEQEIFKESYRYNSTLTVYDINKIDLKVETSMPDPDMSDGDMLNDFYKACVFEFEGVGALFGLVDSEDYARWIEEREGLEIAHSRLGEYINIYAFIKDFGIEYEDAYEALVYDGIGGLTASELDLIYSGNEAEIARYFASDYSIVVGESVYSPYWLYIHSYMDYSDAGITRKAVRDNLEYYSRLPLSIDAMYAFETKLSNFLGEKVTFDLGITEMYWGDIYQDAQPDYESVESYTRQFFRFTEDVKINNEEGKISMYVSFVPEVGSFPIKEDIYEDIAEHALRVISFYPSVEKFQYAVLWDDYSKETQITVELNKNAVLQLENVFYEEIRKRNSGEEYDFTRMFSSIVESDEAAKWKLKGGLYDEKDKNLHGDCCNINFGVLVLCDKSYNNLH